MLRCSADRHAENIELKALWFGRDRNRRRAWRRSPRPRDDPRSSSTVRRYSGCGATGTGTANSPLEEEFSCELVSEWVVFRAREYGNSEAFMDDNRGGKGYFGLENGGISVFAPRSFPCYLDPKLLIILLFSPSGV